MAKRGLPLSLEEEAKKTVEQLLKKYYNRGFRDGRKAKQREEHPEIHYCRECIYWNGDRTSIGVRCTNNNRRKVGYRSTADYKVASQMACKTGFRKKEADNEHL